jgi:hypothetical protein
VRPLLDALKISIGSARSAISFHSAWLSRGTVSRSALLAAGAQQANIVCVGDCLLPAQAVVVGGLSPDFV